MRRLMGGGTRNGSSEGMRFLGGAAQHIGQRKEQQDTFYLAPCEEDRFTRHAGHLLLLSDGMGGIKGGGDASVLAVRQFHLSYRDKEPGESIPDALSRSLGEANRAVALGGEQHGRPGAMGATLIAAALHAEGLHWVSVGDSRLYLLRRGKLRQLNKGHSYGDDVRARIARGELPPESAATEPNQDALMSHMGKHPLPLVDRPAAPLRLQIGDRVILATDGCFRALTEAEMVECIRGKRSPQASCDALLARVLEKRHKHQDNVTVVIAQAAAASRDLPGRGRAGRIALGIGLGALALAAAIWLLSR